MKRSILFVMASLALLAQGGFRGAGRYEIFSPLSRKVLDMDRNDRRTIIQFDARHTDNQTWDITDAGGGYFYIRNVMNGNALAVGDDRNSTPLIAEPFSSSPQQQWRFESAENTTAVLVNRNGKAADVPGGSKNNGTKVNSYNRNNEENQRWQLQEVQGNFGNTTTTTSNNNRNDRSNRGGTGGGGTSRYDTPGPNGSGARDADGVYYDDRDRMTKMDGDGVCFYRDRDFRGDAVCGTVRYGRPRWNASFTDIGSVKFFGRATSVQIFDREEYRGNSIEVAGDEKDFKRLSRGSLRGAPQSIRVY
jgi:hypothetical protein